jgi:tetratricopeptide (TPR) repeat protein
MRTATILAVWSALVLAAVAQAQQPAQESEVDKMAREGRADLLEARFRGGTKPEELHLLAQAYTNKGRRTRQPAERQQAFDKAEEKYNKWIEALERAGKSGSVPDTVRLAAARVEHAGMILSAQAAGELDEFEITAGQRGDRPRLTKLLEAARAKYDKAQQELAPIVEDLSRHEEDLMAAGLLDLLQQARLDLTLNLGWTDYYLALLEEKDEARRNKLLAAAEHNFGELADSGQTGQMRYRCYLAVAMAQRELGKLDEAEKSFGYALGNDVDAAIAAQVRYERARCQIKAGKFDEARTTLAPLVAKDPQALGPDDLPARFHINLAHVWDANSYLLEAEVVRREARDSTAATAILQRAQRCREMGLAKMKRLSLFGGAWPGLVQLYVAASVNLKTPMRNLTPIELLYTAGALLDAKKYPEALERLQEAAERENLEPETVADVLYETGRCQYQLKNLRVAAEAFAKMAAEYRTHEKAPQAATFAYGLWGKIAEGSKKPDDYLQLAATLRNLLESFADHPKREEALWLLPVALQLGGKFDEAAAEFGKLPDKSPNWEEAQYRRAVCGRKAVEARRGSLGAEEYRAQAQAAAQALVQYSEQSRERAGLGGKSETLLKWSSEAELSAAELLAAPGVEAYDKSLAAVSSFETQYPKNELLGRALAVRIRAYRGQRDFEQASKILQQYLQTAPPAQVGPTLTALAKGMQEEVQRLVDGGEADAARKLATDSLATFEELQKWVAADASRAANLEFVQSGRAEMHYLAGQYDQAQALVAELLKKSPKNGNYQHLQARLYTVQLTPDSSPADLKRAQDAWGVLLADAAIRKRAPERYWEARFNWLDLALRLGQAADVDKAIAQERVWYPDLGGAPWKEKLEALYLKAREIQGLPPETQPTSAPTTAPTEESAAPAVP